MHMEPHEAHGTMKIYVPNFRALGLSCLQATQTIDRYIDNRSLFIYCRYIYYLQLTVFILLGLLIRIFF